MRSRWGGRAAARLWYARALAGGAAIPYPRDEAVYRSGEQGAERVLLLGNGLAHGWGVVTHELSLTGALGRALSRRTNVPCDVDFVGEELMSLASAMPWLGNRDLAVYDLMVVVIGMNDAIRLTSVVEWERDLTALIEQLGRRGKPDARVLLAGIPPIASIPTYRGSFARAGQRRADLLNAATERIAEATKRVAYVPIPEPRPEVDRPYGSAKMYAELASTIADRGAPLLERARVAGDVRASPPTTGLRWEWAGAERAMAYAAARGTPVLHELASAAKREFGVTLATVTLFNDDRLWFAASSAGTPVSIPIGLSYCEAVRAADAPLVVPDAAVHPRYRDNPFIELSHLPFYAGHPVHGVSGEVIGTFCLLNVTPRPASSVPSDRLLDYALRAEEELQRLELDALAQAPERAAR